MNVRLIALFLVAIQAVPCFARAPEWADFCPERYLDAQTEPVKPPSKGFALASALLIAPMPFYYNKAKKAVRQSEENYWAKRRHNFEGALELCSSSSDQAACYMALRGHEEQQNASHTMDLRMRELSSSVQWAGRNRQQH